MSTEQQAPANDGALSIDQFTAQLDAVIDAPEQDEEEAQAAGDEADPVEALADDEVAEDEELTAADEEEVEEEEAEPSQAAPPPKSWPAEDQALWAKVPTEIQAVIAKREADRDRAVHEATTKAGRAAAEVKTLAEGYSQVAERVTDDVTRAATAWQERWGNVDWVAYAQQDPQAYIAHKAQADAERQQIVDYARYQEQVRADADKAAKLAREAFLTEEWSKLAELSPELVDPKEGKARRTEVVEYLGAQGFTQDVLSDLSAVEMTIARKAMLWDNAQKAAKKQAELPRKNPTNTAKPIPSGGTGAAAPSTQRIVAAANARLAKNGRVDDLVALFDAEDALKARKGRFK